MITINDNARKVTIGCYIADVIRELPELDNDLDHLLRMVRTIGDLSHVITYGDRDILEVLGVVGGEVQQWMTRIMEQAAK